MAHIIETALFPKKLSPKERIRVLVDEHRMLFDMDADAEAEILAINFLKLANSGCRRYRDLEMMLRAMRRRACLSSTSSFQTTSVFR